MHYVTFVCETCDTEYTVDGNMDMPPYWMGVQIVIAAILVIYRIMNRRNISTFALENVP